jgi:hypothetical protein
MPRGKVKDREFFGTWFDDKFQSHRFKLQTANPATITDLEFICKVLNGEAASKETSLKLAKLVTEWQESGPNLVKMMMKPANLKLWNTLINSCHATWTITETGGAYINHTPGIALRKFGHSRTRDEEQEAQAVILFYSLTIGPWEKLGGPCPRCRVYFIKKRANHKIYCGRKCGSLASAKKATRERLDKEHKHKLEQAQAAIQEWNALKRRPAMSWKQWVITKEPDITSKFLTRAVNKGELIPPAKGE